MGSVVIQFEKHHCHITQNDIQKTVSLCFDEKDALDHFLLEKPFSYDKNTLVIIHLPAEHIITHEFILDKTISDAEIDAFIAQKSPSTFGYSIERLSFDFHSENHSALQKRISVIAAHRSLIDDIAASFQMHKIKIDRITASDRNEMLNLLPWREQTRKRRQRNIVSLLILFSVSCLIGVVLLNKCLSRASTELDQKIVDINHVIQKIALSDMGAKNSVLEKIKNRYQQSRKTQEINLRLENILATIATVLPDTLRLTQFNITADKIILSGISNTFPDIAYYRESLQKALSPKNINLTDVHADPKNPTVTDFSMVLIV